AKGCNIGLGKLASISAGIEEHTLHNTVNWFFSLDNIRKANNRIVDAIHNLKLSSAISKTQKFSTHRVTEERSMLM
ncbi:Tn3 family transposase, partial [Oleiphilus sp. HI0132]|uniref:Tn3 family transposase n=1 Tax=Oleiphilus sp. HI0132 TaxID=1822270 RepID=UPI000A9FD7F4